MDQAKIEEKACEIDNWLQTAVGEVAYDLHVDDIEMFYGKELANEARRMKREGYDWKGWFADELYNTVDVLMDLVGDQIHDGVTQLGVKYNDKKKFDETFTKIALALKASSHTALRKACDKLIEGRSNYTRA